MSCLRISLFIIYHLISFYTFSISCKKWDSVDIFQNLKKQELPETCQSMTGMISTSPSCCTCHRILHHIEKELNQTTNDYEIDVVFRISEKKKKILYSRSEDRILQVLDTICHSIPSEFTLSEISKKHSKLIQETCEKFVADFEEDLVNVFYDNVNPDKGNMCLKKAKACLTNENEKSEL